MEAIATNCGGGRPARPPFAAARIAFLATLALVANESWPQTNDLEDAVKAAYLCRFTQYVEWPKMPKAPLTIAVMDAPEVAAELSKLLASHPLQNATIRVRAIHSSSEVAEANVLYVGPEPSDRLRSILGAVSSRPLLVVTDNPEGLSLGSTINFLKVDKHIRFEVSTGAAERSKLRVSSELLAVAVRVKQRDLP
jgi:hypothetical protein